jgi:hypothetical protein
MVQCITIHESCEGFIVKCSKKRYFGNISHFSSHGVETRCKRNKKNIDIMKKHV